jgi:hypothetical protein
MRRIVIAVAILAGLGTLPAQAQGATNEGPGITAGVELIAPARATGDQDFQGDNDIHDIWLWYADAAGDQDFSGGGPWD